MRVKTPGAVVEIFKLTLVDVHTAAGGVAGVARLAGAAPGPRQVGAVRVGRAVVPALRALVLVPAAHLQLSLVVCIALYAEYRLTPTQAVCWR